MFEHMIIKLPLLLILIVLMYLFIGAIRQDVKAKRPFFLAIDSDEDQPSP